MTGLGSVEPLVSEFFCVGASSDAWYSGFGRRLCVVSIVGWWFRRCCVVEMGVVGGAYAAC